MIVSPAFTEMLLLVAINTKSPVLRVNLLDAAETALFIISSRLLYEATDLLSETFAERFASPDRSSTDSHSVPIAVEWSKQ